jgi:peptide/nickel transport system permease protein
MLSRESAVATAESGKDAGRGIAWRALLLRIGGAVVPRVLQLFALVLVITTVLFILLQFSGDPAAVLAGESGDPAVMEEIREQYGLNDPLFVQYLDFVMRVFTLDYGTSYTSLQPALGLVLDRLPWTLLLASVAVLINLAVSVPLGAWLGYRDQTRSGRAVSLLVFISQGIPGYVVGLVLIQIFAVSLGILPSIGGGGIETWILPGLTLAAFVVPRLSRVIAVNVREAMQADYIRTARATGTPGRRLLWAEALPNALLGATALIGTQFAYLLSGSIITEVIYSWPGVGLLLINAVLTLDFPVVQATVFVIAVLVYVVNTFIDIILTLLDPRQRRQRA